MGYHTNKAYHLRSVTNLYKCWPEDSLVIEVYLIASRRSAFACRSVNVEWTDDHCIHSATIIILNTILRPVFIYVNTSSCISQNKVSKTGLSPSSGITCSFGPNQ